MNARIRSLIDTAEARLPGTDQDDLAELMEEFLSARAASSTFTADEWVLLRQIDAESFVTADPAAVAAVFARRG